MTNKIEQAEKLATMHINDKASAKAFIFGLAQAGMLFHFDDGAHDCLRSHDLPETVLDGIQRQVNKLWEVLEDPFLYALEALDGATN